MAFSKNVVTMEAGGLFVIAILFPIINTVLATANITDTTQVIVWNLLPTLLLVIYVLGMFKRNKLM